ncbi:MAG TPA: DUF1501 domain-containing protein, partial [Anaerolineaceae bacterium]|nr:DUF1501 domain-containing protein [Anaerolineaceae bacterium]
MPVPLKTGEVLRGRYKIAGIIGQGGMGSIYLAEDTRLEGRQCALKEVEHDRSLSPDLLQEARDQFFREASILARLDHPNLPKVSDYFSIGARDYLVMDYVPGNDLRTLIIETRQKGQFLDEELVLGWASQLADALDLSKEDPRIVARYGMGDTVKRIDENGAPRVPQSFLTARRLVEAGARVVTVNYSKWDWHGGAGNDIFSRER